MQRAEAQHSPTQKRPDARQGKGVAFESPQGEQIAQLEAMAENNHLADRLAQLAAMADASPAVAAQRKLADMTHGSLPMAAQRAEAPAKPNRTGLPDNLKSGIESLSGMSLDNVRVHHNSSPPAQLNALAYAQGADIHVAPGQEQHLPHEAWHVVQQAQGRVKPTMQMKDGVPVNGDMGLEHEADVMGKRAVDEGPPAVGKVEAPVYPRGGAMQRVVVSDDMQTGENIAQAFAVFMKTLREMGGEVAHYLAFVDNPENHHNLVFKAKAVEKEGGRKEGVLHGSTNITFQGTPHDILQHMFDNSGLRPEQLKDEKTIEDIVSRVDMTEVMQGVDVVIEIVVDPTFEVPILLETLNHEFSVHAIKWREFIESVSQGQKEKALSQLRTRIGKMPDDHDEFGRGENVLYAEVRDRMIREIERPESGGGTEQGFGGLGLKPSLARRLQDLSQEAIVQHRPTEMVRQELDEMMRRTEELATISFVPLRKKAKEPSQKPKESNKPCFLTTAAVQMRGLSDGCEELTILRRYRDEYLREREGGEAAIRHYYAIAPLILKRINRRDDEEEVLECIFQVITRCVGLIKQARNEKAFLLYRKMVLALENFGPHHSIRYLREHLT